MFIPFFSCNSGDIFTDESFRDTLNQKIGGVLIRDIHHYNDHQAFNYDVQYTYQDKQGKSSKIGFGSYYCETPPANEQLLKLGNLLVFKTSGDRNKDMLFICDTANCKWTGFEISPHTIESSELWKRQRIDSQVDNWDSVAKIKSIDTTGNVLVDYIFPKRKRIFSFITSERRISYKIDPVTGRLEISRIIKI